VTLKIVVTPHAKRDLDEITYQIAKDRPLSAIRFIDAAQATVKLLSLNPEIGSMTQFSSSRLAGVRRWRVKGFQNYLIFYQYQVVNKSLTILRVLHGARDIEAIFQQVDE
jgi:toxin ParE1/3/4